MSHRINRRNVLVGSIGLVVAGVVGKVTLKGGQVARKFVSSTKIGGMPINQATGVLIDWKARAIATYAVLFDFKAKGPNLPVIWVDTERRNYNFDMFALPAYLGDYRQNPQHQGSHESLSGIGAVLGASLTGIDMRNYQGRDFVKEILGYHQQNGIAKILLNQTQDSGSEASFWYMIYPNIAFYAVNSLYPTEPIFDDISREIADQFLLMMANLKNIAGELSFEYAGYSFLKKEGVDGSWKEPDSAAGIAWVLYMAYFRYQDKKYLEGAKTALDYLEKKTVDENPFYEVLLAYGVITAARMNLEEKSDYDVGKFFDWIFDGFSSTRAGWGIISDVWGVYEVHGLQGSVVDSGGYAFAFNTFNMVAALAPLPIYAPEYTQEIGKWLYNVALSARLFYPDQLPAENQSQPELMKEYGGGIAYEGIRKEWAFKYPFATADSRRSTWAETDLGIYGSGLVGVMSGLISKVEPTGVVVFEISKTDFFPVSPRSVFLAYNPTKAAQSFQGKSLASGESRLFY
ncbi:MAG: hypothetical protein WCO85_06880 [Actinomycetes bacterium]|jgi:hypothetical protein